MVSDRLTVNRIAGPGDRSAVRAALVAIMADPPRLPADSDLTPSLPQAGAVPGQWVNATGRPAVEAGVTLYAHGGGFELGNPEFEQVMAYRLSKATGRAVRAVDYRLAPAHPFPAAHDDVVTAYQSLLDHGVPASRVLLFGESAGATLVLSALHTMRSQNLPLPSGAIAVSPITDFTLSSPSIDAPAGEDVLSRPVLERITAQYLDGAAPERSPQSPLHGDLAGLPPLLIPAGGDEALLDDARRFAIAASAAGTPVTLDIYQGMSHTFHLSALSETPPQVATTFLDRLTAWTTALPGAETAIATPARHRRHGRSNVALPVQVRARLGSHAAFSFLGRHGTGISSGWLRAAAGVHPRRSRSGCGVPRGSGRS